MKDAQISKAKNFKELEKGIFKVNQKTFSIKKKPTRLRKRPDKEKFLDTVVFIKLGHKNLGRESMKRSIRADLKKI